MRGSLNKRIESLERQLLKSRVDWGAIYDTVKEMRRTIGQMENEHFDSEYEGLYGTREAFIKKKEERTI